MSLTTLDYCIYSLFLFLGYCFQILKRKNASLVMKNVQLAVVEW